MAESLEFTKVPLPPREVGCYSMVACGNNSVCPLSMSVKPQRPSSMTPEWDYSALVLQPTLGIQACVSITENTILCSLSVTDPKERDIYKRTTRECALLTRASSSDPLSLVRDCGISLPPGNPTGYSLTRVGGCVYAFGGVRGNSEYTSDLHILSLDTYQWETLRNPSESSWHRFKRRVRTRLGGSASVPPQEVWPCSRINHLAVGVGHRLVIIGGSCSVDSELYPDSEHGVTGNYAFDTETRLWSRWSASTAGVYAGTSYATGSDREEGCVRVTHGRHMITTQEGSRSVSALPFIAKGAATLRLGRYILALSPRAKCLYAYDTVSQEWVDMGACSVGGYPYPKLVALDECTAAVCYNHSERRRACIATLMYPPAIINPDACTEDVDEGIVPAETGGVLEESDVYYD
ncbi:hypothetical protein KIPB_005554 [Kipferlia bialata]|uniref:Uncharacterized protein n=1 Tax=Kipferlia bialata TaxID=797122 RepID=A0A9K3CX63_9EUKA|nr:hypothetical protein KIPB_005554 [Kipferlia bialata]|eukprot:g5554.t1